MTNRQIFLAFVDLHRAVVILERALGTVSGDVIRASLDPATRARDAMRDHLTKALARPHRRRGRR